MKKTTCLSLSLFLFACGEYNSTSILCSHSRSIPSVQNDEIKSWQINQKNKEYTLSFDRRNDSNMVMIRNNVTTPIRHVNESDKICGLFIPKNRTDEFTFLEDLLLHQYPSDSELDNLLIYAVTEKAPVSNTQEQITKVEEKKCQQDNNVTIGSKIRDVNQCTSVKQYNNMNYQITSHIYNDNQIKGYHYIDIKDIQTNESILTIKLSEWENTKP